MCTYAAVNTRVRALAAVRLARPSADEHCSGLHSLAPGATLLCYNTIIIIVTACARVYLFTANIERRKPTKDYCARAR